MENCLARLADSDNPLVASHLDHFRISQLAKSQLAIECHQVAAVHANRDIAGGGMNFASVSNNGGTIHHLAAAKAGRAPGSN
jgi:hypothetical protein